jgi:hypothetical protein
LLGVAKLSEGVGAIGIEIELAITPKSLTNANAKSSPPLVKNHADTKYFNVYHL